jgi:hypothetical protein
MSSHNKNRTAATNREVMTAAVQLARSRGVFLAAALLKERGVALEVALELLANRDQRRAA